MHVSANNEPADEIAAPARRSLARRRTRSRGSDPQPAAFPLLIVPTGLLFTALFQFYRSDLNQQGGPSPIMTLFVAFPALPLFVLQKVRNGKQALLLGTIAGLAACFALAALLGFNKDWADYTGIAAGAVVFDLVFWQLTRKRQKQQRP